MAATRIVSRFGSGVPSVDDIVKGELAIDLTNQIIYTNDGTQIVELAGGVVDWEQIDPDTIPIEIINIINNPDNPNYVDLAELKAQVNQNTIDISTNSGAIAGHETRIKNLETAVAALEAWAETVDDAVGNLDTALTELAGKVSDNTTNIGVNAGDIADIKAELALLEAGLQFGGTYDASTSQLVAISDYADSLGVQPGNLPLGQAFKGLYFIVVVEGTLSGSATGNPDLEGAQIFVGDWLICEGNSYVAANYGLEAVSFGQIGGDPYDNAALKAALDAKLSKEDDVLEGGTYIGTARYKSLKTVTAEQNANQ